MNQRSLVGMTMGARKRSALYESLHTQDTGPAKLTNREARMVWASVCNMVAHSRPWRDQVRKSYRIGQRLRPCPGCHGCMPGKKGWHIDNRRGRFKTSPMAWCCEGSGVLPAKKAKAKR